MNASMPPQCARKPVAAYSVHPADPTEATGYEVVVCDDGAVFWREEGARAWEQDAPIPGTARERAARDAMPRTTVAGS